LFLDGTTTWNCLRSSRRTERSKDVASFLDNEDRIANAKIDFNAMEEVAKAVMAARKSK
jgi:hypothetical protein